MNNKGSDQTAPMRRLVGAFVVRKSPKTGFMVTCWKRGVLLALLCVMFYGVFVTFPCGVFGQVRCLIVLIPDFCLLSNHFSLATRPIIHKVI